jgi:transcriptional regulator with XRE-family HTH domain
MELSKREISKKIGDNIRDIRIKKGLTIESLANESGLDYSQISRIELGRINTSIYQIYKISKTLSVALPQIFEPII